MLVSRVELKWQIYYCLYISLGMDIAVCEGTSQLWEVTYYMGSRSVTCHLAAVTLPQPKLVLDLATPEGYEAELS